MKQFTAFSLLALAASSSAWGLIDVTSSTSEWTAINFASGGQSDYYEDQQTGKAVSDIVGDVAGNQTGFYKQYLDAGVQGDMSDDFIAFRARLSSGDSKKGLDTNVLVALDLGNDGSVDLFVGMGKKNSIRVYDPGDGLNISPSTTSVNDFSGTGDYNWVLNEGDPNHAGRFDFSAVSAANDHYLADGGAGASADLDANGDIDYFASFQIDMATLIAAADQIASITLSANTEMSYMLLTSNQDNAFNQDLAGHDGAIGNFSKSTETWVNLGGLSGSSAGPSGEVVPEPETYALILGSLALGFVAYRRRK